MKDALARPDENGAAVVRKVEGARLTEEVKDLVEVRVGDVCGITELDVAIEGIAKAVSEGFWRERVGVECDGGGKSGDYVTDEGFEAAKGGF